MFNPVPLSGTSARKPKWLSGPRTSTSGIRGLSNAAASHWPIQISRSLSGIMEYGSVLLDDAHRWARVRASEQIDRLWAAAIIGRFPRYIHQLSSRLALPKTVLSISSGLKDHRVLFGRRWKTNKEKKKEKSMPASRRGEDDVCPKRSLHACVGRVCGFMPAHYSSLPLTGNYAEWKLSLPKWASIVCRLSIPLCCHIQPIRFRETEIIARRIETAIPAPFNRSSCTKRWKTLETPKRFLRFRWSIFSHRRDVATGSRKTATRSTNMVEDWRACLELDVNFQRWEPARLFSQSPVSRMILENW